MHRMSRFVPLLLAYLAWRLLADDPLVLTGVVVVGAIGYFAYRWWRRRRDERERARRTEVVGRRLGDAARERFPSVADRILDLEDRVTLADSSVAEEHFRAATDAFMTADDRMADAGTSEDFMEVLDRLDDAEWHLDAVEAALDGRPLPERSPTPVPPSRRPATTRASLERWGSSSGRERETRRRRRSC